MKLRHIIHHLVAAIVLATATPVAVCVATAQSAVAQTKKGSAKKGAAKKKGTGNTKSKKKGTGKKGTEKGRTQKEIKQEQKKTAEEIKLTTGKINENERSTARQLTRLSDLHTRMEQQSKVIDVTRNEADTLERRISRLNDSIVQMQRHLEELRTAYARVLRQCQGVEKLTGKLAFVFAAESFDGAVARVRYLRRIATWRRRKAQELQQAMGRLDNRQAAMATLLQQKQAGIARLNSAHAQMERDTRETSRIVDDLRREGSQLRSHLAAQQQRLAALDSELDRLIAAEQERQRKAEEERRRKAEQQRKKEEQLRKKKEEEEQRRKAAQTQGSQGEPASAKPSAPAAKPKPEPEERTAAPLLADATSAASSAFASQKGRLPFPVEGRYKVIGTFGRQPHPDVPGVEVNNSGIDIEMAGTSDRARAIAAGTVSAVFRQPGYENIVMVRHGEYIAIYAGISELAVSKGQEVKAGTGIGRIHRDPDRDNRRVLHFELRHERDKLNPLLWVRR